MLAEIIVVERFKKREREIGREEGREEGGSPRQPGLAGLVPTPAGGAAGRPAGFR